jgi:hypothetical protein
MVAPQFASTVVRAVLYMIHSRAAAFQLLFACEAMSQETTTTSAATATPKESYAQKRRSRRVKMSRPVRVRPSEPRDDHFEDLITSVNASKEGVYFHSRRKGYYKGMRVFVTFPYTSSHDPMNCEYVAEVVRVEDLPNGKFGVAVDLKMSMNYSKK